jgi:hypothetical protein
VKSKPFETQKTTFVDVTNLEPQIKNRHESQEEVYKSKRDSQGHSAENLVRNLSIENTHEESKKINNAFEAQKNTETNDPPSHQSFITSIRNEVVKGANFGTEITNICYESNKKGLQDLSIDGMVPTDLDYIFKIESYQVVILIIISLNNKSINPLT